MAEGTGKDALGGVEVFVAGARVVGVVQWGGVAGYGGVEVGGVGGVRTVGGGGAGGEKRGGCGISGVVRGDISGCYEAGAVGVIFFGDGGGRLGG